MLHKLLAGLKVHLCHSVEYDRFQISPNIYLIFFYHSKDFDFEKNYLRMQWRFYEKCNNQIRSSYLGTKEEKTKSLLEILDMASDFSSNEFLDFIIYHFNLVVKDEIDLDQLIGALKDYECPI